METRIFISCSGAEPLAQSLAERLKNSGFKVLVDKDDFDAGSAAEHTALDAIKTCSHFLPVFAENNFNRYPTMRKKLDCAVENRKKIIPLMLNGFNASHLPASLKNLPSGTGLELSRQNFEEVAGKLTSILENSAPLRPEENLQRLTKVLPFTSMTPASQAEVTKRNWLPYLLLLIAFLAGGLIFSRFDNNIKIENHNGGVPDDIGVKPRQEIEIHYKRGMSGNTSIQQAVVSGEGNFVNQHVNQQQVTVSGAAYSTVTQIQNGHFDS